MFGVMSVGVSAKTSPPVPVSPVTAAARFAEDGVARNVATPVQRPSTPVLIGRPVAFVSTPLAGVPSAGVTNVGLVANTNAPEPVSSEIVFLSSREVVAAKSLNLLAVLALPAARSYAALTAAGVAAFVVELLEYESSSCTAPLTLVVPSAMVMFGVLPPDEAIAPEPVTEVTVPAPVERDTQAAPS
jgi:hypothetical protein